MTTALELAGLVAGAIETDNAVVVARWEGPADMLATPAVVVSPGEPWLELPRLGARALAHWSVAIVGGRWEAPAALELAQAGYLASAPLIGALEDFSGLEPLSAPYPETIGGTPTLVTRFAVVLTI